MNRPAAHRVLSIAALGGTLLVAASILWVNRDFYHDDAYISLRYASNLISGYGAVWNPGEYVQGYTNFLHLVLVSSLGALGLDLVTSSRFIGVAGLVGILGILLVFGARGVKDNSNPLWYLPALLAATSAPLLVWSIGGLEGTLFSLLATAGCLLIIVGMDQPDRHSLLAASGACLGLGYLTRPDGVVFILISGGWLLWAVAKHRRGLTGLLSFAGAAAAIIAPYVLWQAFYYGDVVPNTFYAKASGPSWSKLLSGYRYVVGFMLRPTFLPLLVIASLAYAIILRVWNLKLTYLTLAVSGYMLFVIIVGGDHMQSYRFMLPVIPLMSCLFSMAMAPMFEGSNRLTAGAIILAVLLLSGLQITDSRLSPRKQDPAASVGTIVGKYIASQWPADSLIALNTAGSVPYFANRHRYIDMLGLNDAHIGKRKIDKIQLYWQTVPGHLKGDGAYVLARNPDYIIVGPAEGTLVSKPWFLSDLEMSQDPMFSRNYEEVKVNLNNAGAAAEDGPLTFTYYQRRRLPNVK